jgi:hypothetical protein
MVSAMTLPATLAHEVVHAALAAPWAERVGIVIQPRNVDAGCAIDWRDGVPNWAVALAAYGPALVGVVLGIASLGWLALGGSWSSTPRGWLVRALLAVWWVVFTLPSGADRDATNTDTHTDTPE